MSNDKSIGMLNLQLQHRFGLHGIVDGADTVPKEHIPSGNLVDISAEVFVRSENNLLVFWERAHQFLGVARGADKVGEGFYLCRAIDVADNHVVGMFGLEFLEILGLAALGQRATGFHIGQQHLAAGIENLCRLGHEMDTAEDDDVGRSLLCFLCQSKAVAYVIGEFLYLMPLVIVTENDSIFFFFQSQDFLFQLLLVHNVYIFFETAKVRKKNDTIKYFSYSFFFFFLFSLGC